MMVKVPRKAGSGCHLMVTFELPVMGSCMMMLSQILSTYHCEKLRMRLSDLRRWRRYMFSPVVGYNPAERLSSLLCLARCHSTPDMLS